MKTSGRYLAATPARLTSASWEREEKITRDGCRLSATPAPALRGAPDAGRKKFMVPFSGWHSLTPATPARRQIFRECVKPLFADFLFVLDIAHKI
jgi:hypothetical protein